MDSLEINKAFAAILTAGIAFVGSGLLAEALVHPHRLEHSVLKIEGVGQEAAPEPPRGPVGSDRQPAGHGRCQRR